MRRGGEGIFFLLLLRPIDISTRTRALSPPPRPVEKMGTFLCHRRLRPPLGDKKCTGFDFFFAQSNNSARKPKTIFAAVFPPLFLQFFARVNILEIITCAHALHPAPLFRPRFHLSHEHPKEEEEEEEEGGKGCNYERRYIFHPPLPSSTPP